MSNIIRHNLKAGTIWEGDWLQAPLEPGYTMAEVDGPYALKKAAWDRMNMDGLADWYVPHLERLTSLMLPSSSVYLWNTAEGWARLDPVMRELGWEFRSLVVWDKGHTPAQIGFAKAQEWPDCIEVCGFYCRGAAFFRLSSAEVNVWKTPPEMASERLRSGESKVRKAGHPAEALPLHPCQKPLLFAERMVQASTRPLDRVLVPFGGTCRIAVYLERLAQTEPENMRYHDTAELNQDGRDYLGAVLGRMNDKVEAKAGQIPLFGGK